MEEMAVETGARGIAVEKYNRRTGADIGVRQGARGGAKCLGGGVWENGSVEAVQTGEFSVEEGGG